MRVFWAKGYVGTSYDDLVSGTGVSRKGLYTAFGDKRGLFLAALKTYRNVVVPELFCALDESNITSDSIRQMFRGYVEMACSAAGQKGCFLVRTSADETIEDADVKAILDAHWEDLYQRFERALSRAGYEATKAERLAHFFVGVMQGLLTLAHARAGRERIKPFVEEALSALE
ncbi:MAG: TetR/AcrR family transcriptional regulator [Pseudomonadota bacterium]